MQYEICVHTKTDEVKALKVFIDGKPLCNESDKYIWNGSKGIHRIKIEQVKIFKSKWYWIYAPIVFLLGVLAGDIQNFDDKTPFYAIYEADIFVDDDLEITVSLTDINRHKGESEKGFEYKIIVDLSREDKIEVIKNEFTVTKKERILWFLMHFTLYSLLFGFVVFLLILGGVRGMTSGLGMIGSVFLLVFSLFFIAEWVFMTYMLYIYSNGKYKRIKRI